MASTWDRTGWNLDGWDFKDVQGTTNVLLEADGPGCIHRLFTGQLGNAVDGTRIQIILDRDSRPVFDLPVEQFFSELSSPFQYPLVSTRTYPGLLMPIPYAKQVKVQLVSEREVPNWGNYWQIVYTTYHDDRPLRTLTWPPDEVESEELRKVAEAWLLGQTLAPEPPAAWPAVLPRQSLSAGAMAALEIQGCGTIKELRVALEPRVPQVLKGVRLKIFWDGLGQASVDVPLGYFFGVAGYDGDDRGAHFASLLLGADAQELYSRFPMPFAAGARLELHNQSDAPVSAIELRLDYETCTAQRADHGRFHATWNQRPAALPGGPAEGPLQVAVHVVLDQEARGKYVGAMLALDWPYLEWWGEGDWMVWTDEQEWPPSYHGTGSEEYFNSGFTVFDRKAISGFVKTRPGPVSLYSFHLNDAFQFQQRIRVVEETMGLFAGDAIIHATHPSWSSTAFWYALPARPAGSHPP
jgi:hypothetical protein